MPRSEYPLSRMDNSQQFGGQGSTTEAEAEATKKQLQMAT